MKEKISAVIVTYNPGLSNVKSLVRTLKGAGVFCCVVDNSQYFDFAGLSDDALILSLGDNKGIAAAQNIGVNECLVRGADKIVFFDQDSVVEESFIESLNSTFQDASVSIAAPVFYDREKGFGYKLVDIDGRGMRRKIRPEDLQEPIDVSVVISSGTMVKAEVFKTVGLMDERLFIDYVDTEWCLRCAAKGISVRVNPDARMLHSIGDRSVGFLGFNIPVHGALRRYYRVRNSLLLLRLKHVPLLLAVREIFFSFVHQVIIFCCAKDKFGYLKYYFRGVWDGVLGVTGKIK